MPHLGDFLGDFKNELELDEFIIEFVSGGAKNYAYKLNNGKTDCTVKGYAINFLTNLILNFDSIKNCVDNPTTQILIPQLKFFKEKSTWLIKTCIINKTYNCMTYNKRLLKINGETLPFGFKEI